MARSLKQHLQSRSWIHRLFSGLISGRTPSAKPVVGRPPLQVVELEDRIVPAILLNETFEVAFPVSNNWTANTSQGRSWDDVGVRAYSGSRSGFASFRSPNDNRYVNNMTTVMERTVNLSGYASPSLSFAYWMKTEASCDFLRVKVNGTEIWNDSGIKPTWNTKTLSLASFAGQSSVTVRFEFTSDSTIVPSGDAGVWLDNILLTATLTDSTAPSVNLAGPNSGIYSAGQTVTLTGTASDASGINRTSYELWKGTSFVGTIYQGPSGSGLLSSYAWSVPAALNGQTLNGTDYRVRMVAWDQAGNSAGDFSDGYLTLRSPDTAAPTVTLTAPNGGAFTVGQQITFTGTASDLSGINRTSYELYKGNTRVGTIFQGAPGSGVTSSYTWTVPPVIEGHTINGTDYRIRMVVRDNAANANTGSDFSNNYLTIRPGSSVPSPTVALVSADDSGTSASDNITNVRLPRFQGAGAPNARVQVFVDGVGRDIVTASSIGTYLVGLTAPLTDGVHNIQVRQTNTAGRVSPLTAALTLLIDTQRPATPSTPDLESLSDSGSSDHDDVTKAVTLTILQTAEPGSTVTLWEGSTFLGVKTSGSDGNSRFTINLSEGIHTLFVTAADAAGNTATSSGLWVTVDTTAPSLSLPGNLTAEAAGATGAVMSYNATASDAGSGVVARNASPASGSTFGLGGTTVGISATDLAGNTTFGSFTVTVRDSTPPVLPALPNLIVEATGSTGAAVSYGGMATDAVDGARNLTFDIAPGSTFPLGTRTVGFSATDNSGNSGTGTFTVTVQDTTAPVLSGTPENLTVEATGPAGAVVTYTMPTASDLVDGAVTVSADHVSGTVFPLGATVVSFTAIDSHGNASRSSVTVTVRDTTPPETSIAAGPPSLTKDPSATFDFFGTDAISNEVTFQYRLDEGTLQTGNSASFSNLGDGVHTLIVWVVDSSGNADPTPASYSWVIDATPPTMSAPDLTANCDTGSSDSDDITNLTTLKISVNAEPDSTVRLFEGTTVLGMATADASGNCLFTVVFAEGNHELLATAADFLGNTATSASLRVTVDTTAPTISGSLDRQANQYGWYNADVTVSFTGDDDLSGIDLVSGPTTLGEGAGQSVTGTATDLAGNSANFTLTGINIDKTAPTITGAPDREANTFGWYNADVTVSFTGEDGLSGINAISNSTTLSEGANQSVTGTVTDRAGNTATVTVNGINIDTTAPVAAITPAPAGLATSTDASFDFSGSDSFSHGTSSGVNHLEYWVDGGRHNVVTGGAGSATLTNLNEGSHAFHVVAFDRAGNIAISSYSWVIDLDPGALDTTFGVNGKATTAIRTAQDYAFGVAIDGNGRIVVAGESYNGSNYDIALARYNSDGTLDTSFDGDGKVATDLASLDENAYRVVIDGNNRIVVAGGPSLARYNPDGSLDTTFDVDGFVLTGFVALNMALDGNGRIVVAGRVNAAGSVNFAVARYNVDGSLDNSFGDNGKVTTDFGRQDLGIGMAIDASGKIVVVGYSEPQGQVFHRDFAVARYNEDGSLDTTFDGDGTVLTDFGSSVDAAVSVTTDRLGRIIVVGYAELEEGNENFALARYNPNGSLDTTFDGDGRVTTAITPSSDEAISVAIDAWGKIVVSGFASNGSDSDFAVARYNEDGSLDTSFDGDGTVLTDFGSGTDVGYRLAFDGQGRIVVAGYSHNGSNYDFALARYNGDPPPLPSGEDSSPPDTIIASQPPIISKTASADFFFSGRDSDTVSANLRFEYSLDGGSFSLLGSGSLHLTGLEDDAHTLLVRSIDEAGNADPSPAYYYWLVHTQTEPERLWSRIEITQSATGFTVSTDNKLLLYRDGSAIQVIDLRTGDVQRTFTLQGWANVSDFAQSPSGTYLAYIGSNRTLSIADFATGQVVQTVTFSSQPGTLAWQPGEDALITVTDQGIFRVFLDGTTTLLLSEARSGVGLSPDGHYLIASRDRFLEFLDTQTLAVHHAINFDFDKSGQNWRPRSAHAWAIDPTGQQIIAAGTVSGSLFNDYNSYRLQDGVKIAHVDIGGYAAGVPSFSGDGRLIALISRHINDNRQEWYEVEFHHWEQGSWRKDPMVHRLNASFPIALAPDGSVLYVAQQGGIESLSTPRTLYPPTLNEGTARSIVQGTLREVHNRLANREVSDTLETSLGSVSNSLAEEGLRLIEMRQLLDTLMTMSLADDLVREVDSANAGWQAWHEEYELRVARHNRVVAAAAGTQQLYIMLATQHWEEAAIPLTAVLTWGAGDSSDGSWGGSDPPLLQYSNSNGLTSLQVGPYTVIPPFGSGSIPFPSLEIDRWYPNWDRSVDLSTQYVVLAGWTKQQTILLPTARTGDIFAPNAYGTWTVGEMDDEGSFTVFWYEDMAQGVGGVADLMGVERGQTAILTGTEAVVTARLEEHEQFALDFAGIPSGTTLQVSRASRFFTDNGWIPGTRILYNGGIGESAATLHFSQRAESMVYYPNASVWFVLRQGDVILCQGSVDLDALGSIPYQTQSWTIPALRADLAEEERDLPFLIAQNNWLRNIPLGSEPDFGEIPSGGLLMRPTHDRAAVLVWAPPGGGRVAISGILKDLDTRAGDGIRFTLGVRRASGWEEVIISAGLGNGGTVSLSDSVFLEVGDTLIFTLRAGADDRADSTLIDLHYHFLAAQSEHDEQSLVLHNQDVASAFHESVRNLLGDILTRPLTAEELARRRSPSSFPRAGQTWEEYVDVAWQQNNTFYRWQIADSLYRRRLAVVEEAQGDLNGVDTQLSWVAARLADEIVRRSQGIATTNINPYGDIDWQGGLLGQMGARSPEELIARGTALMESIRSMAESRVAEQQQLMDQERERAYQEWIARQFALQESPQYATREDILAAYIRNGRSIPPEILAGWGWSTEEVPVIDQYIASLSNPAQVDGIVDGVVWHPAAQGEYQFGAMLSEYLTSYSGAVWSSQEPNTTPGNEGTVVKALEMRLAKLRLLLLETDVYYRTIQAKLEAELSYIRQVKEGADLAGSVATFGIEINSAVRGAGGVIALGKEMMEKPIEAAAVDFAEGTMEGFIDEITGVTSPSMWAELVIELFTGEQVETKIISTWQYVEQSRMSSCAMIINAITRIQTQLAQLKE